MTFGSLWILSTTEVATDVDGRSKKNSKMNSRRLKAAELIQIRFVKYLNLKKGVAVRLPTKGQSKALGKD